MLATILLLAQLVQSWPWLDSPLVQPPGMICLGECAGPVVWGPAERGRLVVACDMRSDTCSDGRKITTQRATPVPCETSPGVWEIIPADRGCYGVRGLESWAQNTSYLSWGAELDRSPWTPRRGGTVEKLPDGWRVKNDPNQDNSGLDQVLTGAASGEVWTSAYILRTSNDVPFLLWAGSSQACGGNFALNTGGAWRQFSCSTVVPSNPMAAIFPGSFIGSIPRPQYSVDVKAAWTVKSNTPGRPCWGGEAPVTCAADRHTISTEGWPTEAGEINLTFSPGPSNIHQYIIDGRASGDTAGKTVLMVSHPLKRLLFYIDVGQPATSGPILEVGRWYALKILVRDGRTRVLLDGVEVINVVGTPQFASRATIGNRFEQDEALNGPIRALTVRSYEEVSP